MRKKWIEVVTKTWKDGKETYWWRAKGKNGEILFNAETYKRLSNAQKGAKAHFSYLSNYVEWDYREVEV